MDTISVMREKDVEGVCELYRDANPGTPLEEIIRWTRHSRKRFRRFHLIYWRDGNIQGAVSAVIKRAGGVIEDIGVSHHLRGQGIGSLLLRNVLNRLYAEGVKKVELGIHNQNKHLISFYQQFGFKENGTRMILNETTREKEPFLQMALEMND